MSEIAESADPAGTRVASRSRITHLFYTPQLERFRLTGEPATAFCGYVLRRASGRSQAEIMADPQCPKCEVVLLERNWAKSMR